MTLFKNNLKKYLKLRQMTQREFSKKINITESAMSRYVNGNRMPRGDFLLKMAKVLGVKVEQLLDVKTEKKEGE